jgi:hypothetical protein
MRHNAAFSLAWEDSEQLLAQRGHSTPVSIACLIN